MNILRALQKVWRSLERGRVVLLLTGGVLSLAMTIMYGARPIFFEYLDIKLYDTLMRQVYTPATSNVPVVVDIDEKSLSELGQWPWPRYRIARLLEGVQKLGASVVATDMVFSEPDRTSLAVLQEEIAKDHGWRINFQDVPEVLLDNDKTLAETLAAGPFVLGYHFNFNLESDIKSRECALHKLNLSVLRDANSPRPEDVFFKAPAAICNLKILGEAVERSGFFNALPDPDGIIRHAPLIIAYKGNYYPSLALAAYLQLRPTKQVVLWLKPNEQAGQEPPSLQIGDMVVPLTARGQMTVRFHGPHSSFPYYSASDILLDRLEPDALKGKVAFVGTSAAGLKDIRATPLDQIFPGVEVHANVLENLLRDDFLREPELYKNLEVLLVLFMGLVATVLLAWTGALWSLLPLGLCVGGMWYGSFWTLRQQGIFLSPLVPTLTLVVIFAVLTLLKFWREESQKRFFHQAFSQYVSKAVVEQIVKSPDKLSLSGEEREVSILFSDIRSFTTMSEQLTPHQVSELLQAYFTPMTMQIIRTDGTLDKFIGDAIMAFWNAPLNTKEHQYKSVSSALGMHEALKKLNIEFMQRFNLELQIGVGLHCGTVRVGNMGSKDLFDYTIIGDSVNLASRLEGLTKYYGLGVIASENIRNACRDGELYFQEVDTVRVKGKALPIVIYAPYAEQDRAIYAEELQLYDKGMRLYKAQDFQGAMDVFGSLRKEYRDLKLYALYQERCLQLQQAPPGESWDHVFTHSSK